MSSGPEKNLENAIRAHVEKRGGWQIKIFANEMQGVGYPDLIICYKGFFVAFETKAPSGRTAKVQQSTLNKIKAAGGYAASVRSLAEAKNILDLVDTWRINGNKLSDN